MIYSDAASGIRIKKFPARSRERILVEEKLALSRLLARLLLSAATLLAALSRVLTTLLARLLAATLLATATLLAAALALLALARLLFTRVHKRSFVSPPNLQRNRAL